jgi:antitoxin component of MazEF toxin-antitoxin module
MIKQLRKVGNSQALLLDKPVLELLGLSETSHVQLTIQDGVLLVAPVDPRQVEGDRFEAALNEVLKRRESALRRLAE